MPRKSATRTSTSRKSTAKGSPRKATPKAKSSARKAAKSVAKKAAKATSAERNVGKAVAKSVKKKSAKKAIASTGKMWASAQKSAKAATKKSTAKGATRKATSTKSVAKATPMKSVAQRHPMPSGSSSGMKSATRVKRTAPTQSMSRAKREAALNKQIASSGKGVARKLAPGATVKSIDMAELERRTKPPESLRSTPKKAPRGKMRAVRKVKEPLLK